MTFEQELLRELHRLNKIIADIRKSLDKLNKNLVDISLDKVKEDPLSVKVFGLEDQEERLCYVETVPMGIHVDDGDVDICSNCRVPIDDDCYYCSNCGARIVDKRELLRGDAE